MTGETRRRLLLLALAGAVLVGTGVADTVVPHPARAPSPEAFASAVTSGSTATSSAWYCAAGASAPAGSQVSVVLANPGTRPVTGTLEARTPAGAGQAQGFVVPAKGQLAVPLAAPAATRVLLDGGGVGASEMMTGPSGWSMAPCVSTTAEHWFFAYGSTAPGRAVLLTLYNPTPSDAVVDVAFVSAANGVLAPPAYQGLPVPAGGVAVERISDHVQNDPSFATEVTTLSGSVVAAEASGVGGSSLVAGTTQPRRQWAFAQNTNAPNSVGNFFVLNPSSRATTVRVSVALSQGAAAPIELQVPATSVAVLASQAQTRIPPNAAFGLTFDSSGAGIVVARESWEPGGAAPTYGITLGAPGGQRHWLVPPVPPGTAPSALALLGTTGRRVHVTIGSRDPSGGLVPLPGLLDVALHSGSVLQAAPGAGSLLGQAPVEVVADGPVAVESDPLPGSPGAVVLPAWPLLGPPAA